MSFLKAILSHLYSTLLPQVSGRQQTDCAGAHHGNLTPPRISPSCPHCLWLWLDRSIIIRLLTRVGPVSSAAMRNSPPQAALGRMGTALHLPRPSLMQVSAQVVLAHPPASLWSFLKDLSSADVSRCRIFSFQGIGSKHRQIIDTPSTEQIGPECYSKPEDHPHPMFHATYAEALPALEIMFYSPCETNLADWHRRHSGLARPEWDNSKRESPNQHGLSAQKRRIPLQGLLPFHAFAYIKVEGLRFSVPTGSSLSPPRLAL